MSAYVGRFAPTPSGPLHFGSLVTALGSYLDARSARGRWRLRIDDLDAPRVRPGAIDTIGEQLRAHGLIPDDAPRFQSRCLDRYERALESLERRGLTYACTCSRAHLQSLAAAHPERDEPVYPGTCRDAGHAAGDAALRVRLSGALAIDDPVLGAVRRLAGRDLGDFVVRRRDGLPAYQLACAVDESDQGITDVVRGSDLLPSSLRQCWLMRQLGLQPPRYRHLPLVVDADGRKLSKRDADLAADPARARLNLLQALACLRQPAPPDRCRRIAEILDWAVLNWNAATVGHDPIVLENV